MTAAAWIDMPVVENWNEEMACIVCNLRKCEKMLEILGDVHSELGIHDRCLEQIRERNRATFH